MTIIKLDAIDSTNDYLKQLSKDKVLENLTVVMANVQTKGKGQMGAEWHSEAGKNLLMSILVKDVVQKENSVFDFNVTITLAVAKLLELMKVSNVKVKWPNDIMADGKKIAGILIENVIKSDGSITAVVGIGLNVNQTNFDGIPNATSLCQHSDLEFDNLEDVAKLLQRSIESYLLIANENMDTLWNIYNESLFQLNRPSHFQDKNGHRFNGFVKYVTRDGKLAIWHDDDKIHHYEVKDIKMLF
ncbi:biotin--[acetyl-CoA-carboxylase] ligase [Flavobacterium sp. RSB2_4_14]|uniref:biotin--[acetyl-CoA-carboxylase] ligase n=1 Tax=Flavobacterium sp. RSB2_4_14 TaxID=3447665 RepID=UPI003F309437